MDADKCTISDIAEELDVSYSTALSYVKTKKILGNLHGGRWLVDREELDRFKREGNHPDSKKEAEHV